MPTPKPRRRMPTRTEQANAAAHAAALVKVPAYAREQRLLRAYTQHLYALTTDTDALIAACFGEGLSGKRLDAAYERLDEDVPELIRSMRYDEQEEVELLLRTPCFHCLVKIVGLVLKQERKLIQREPVQVLLNDEPQYRAAGLGRITSENYGRLRPGCLPDLLPAPKQLVVVALPKRASRPRRVNPWVQGSLFGFGAVGSYAQI